jgi:hypothetical protein
MLKESLEAMQHHPEEIRAGFKRSLPPHTKCGGGER